jgi:tRNA threonylcarbamoyladenosine biosynthesis protein TsaE
VTRRATIVCAGKEATADVARRLAGLAAPGQVLVLEGPLGAGKTTFAKAYAAALGVTAPVTSPTFTLVHHYRCAPGGRVASIAHADFWRLAHASEVADLGLDDLLEDGAVALVEWGDLFEGELPNDRITISFRVVDDDTRSLTVDATGSSLDDRALAAIAGPEAGQS